MTVSVEIRMGNHDFYSLPRSLQDRFIESSRGAAAPICLGISLKKDFSLLAWLAGSAVVAVLWGGLTLVGFGDLHSDWAIFGTPQLILLIVLASAFTFCLLQAYGAIWSKENAHFKDGDYLFPCGVIQVRGQTLHEFDIQTCQMSAEAAQLRLTAATGESFSFAVSGGEGAAQQLLAQLQEMQQKWTALPADAQLERARMNPLVESGIPNPLAPTQVLKKPRFLPIYLLAAGAVVLGGLFGFGVFSYRNQLSEKDLYRDAVAENSVEAYQAYLARGGERQDVSELYLPRAELTDAREKGTVQAIEDFLEKNKDSKIVDEVRAFHRQALLEELAKAQKVGTVAALDQLPKKFRAYKLIESELLAARHALYVQALADFQKRAAADQKDLIPAVQALLDYSEKHGPKVSIRMGQIFTQDPETLDRIVSKSKKYYLGRPSLPTQYFLGEIARKREAELGADLLKALQPAFDKEFLHFELAPPVKAENEEFAAIKLPTLTITHSEKLSGGYVGGKPKSMYLGASVTFKADLEIPGAEKPLRDFVTNSWRHPDFNVLEESGKGISDVYEKMMGGAFERFFEKYLATWLAESQ